MPEIKCKSVEHRKNVIAYFQGIGYLWHGEGGWTPNHVEQTYPFRTYSTVQVSTYAKTIGGTGGYSDSKTFIKALEEMNERM